MPLSTGIPAVLVIESAKFQRRSLCRLIRAAGADHVVEAVDIADAERQLAKESGRDWLLVADPDLVAPSNGVAALVALAEECSIASTLLLTQRRASALPELRKEAQSLGLHLLAALRKPISAEEVGTLLLQARNVAAPGGRADSPLRILSKDEFGECLKTGCVRARFQPKVDLQSGRPVSCEAASYVAHPRYGVLHAVSFAQAATQMGAQRVMTASLMRDAAELVRSLRHRGLDTKVAVKLGADMLSEPGDATSLDAYVRTLSIAPADFAFSVAVTKHVAASSAFDDNLARLKLRGYALVMELAGPASSLEEPGYAHFSEIKMHVPNAPALREPGGMTRNVSSLLGAARQRGLSTCAVGIRTEAELEDSRRAGFAFGQGDYFAAALTAEEALSWVVREDNTRSFRDRSLKRSQVS